MLRRTYGDAVYYQFEALAARGVPHGVFTRLGGYSGAPYASLNVGHTVGDDDEAVEANHRLIYGALAVEPQRVVTAHQVHGHHVAAVSGQDGGRVVPATDGLVSAEPGTMLMMRFADCLPVLLYDVRRRLAGLAHAGWRGTMEDVAGHTVRAMQAAFGCDPADLVAGLGPGIGPCCYQVGEEVIQAAAAAFPASAGLVRQQDDGTYHFDLAGANLWQLRRAGVAQCEVAPFCTACDVAEFYSHRAEAGRTGRFAALLGLTAEGN